MRQRKYELLQAAAVIYSGDIATKRTAVKDAYELLQMIEQREHEANLGKAQNPEGQAESIPF